MAIFQMIRQALSEASNLSKAVVAATAAVAIRPQQNPLRSCPTVPLSNRSAASNRQMTRPRHPSLTTLDFCYRPHRGGTIS